MTRKIRFGLQTAPQNTSWQELRATWKLIDSLGYDTAWTDRIAQFIDVGVTHFIPIANTPFNHESIRRFAEEVIPAFRS